MGTAPVLLFLVTALFLLIAVPVPGESKVYYACGAVLDSTENGLILSPGFPNNYLSGFHCVWQFFIPAGSRLQIETLDFDVFESLSDKEDPLSSTSSDITSVTAYKKVDLNGIRTESPLLVSPDSVTILTTTEPFGYLSEVNRKVIVSRKSRDGSYKGEDLSQGFAAKNNILNHGASTSQKGAIPIASKSNDNLRKDSNKSAYTFTGQSMENNEGVTSSSLIMDISTVPYTPQSQLVDVCPDDVLYISDLTRFSMRFCGSNSPLNKMLVFGSPVEMTEVIMELITTTNRGRGFAMLFSYQNQTAVTAMGIQESHSKEDITLLAVISATISFALVLLLVLCLSYRQKMCPKRDHTTDQVTPQLSGAQNAALEVSELHHVALGEDLGRELDLASQEEKGAEQSLPEDPSSSIATVTSDEVFVISDSSNQEHFNFTSYPKGHILKRSVTSPASVSDWLNADYTSVDLSMDDKEAESLDMDPARQRTWSIRTFNSFLPPIPQLQVKWSSRISAGSFTKLVASGCNVPPSMPSPPFPRRAGSAIQIEGSTRRLYSESSDSNASYPLTNSAQLNRKLPSCNLKRTRPYFGFLNGTSDALRSSSMKATCSKEKHICQNSGTEFTSCFKSPMTNGVHTKELSTDVEKPKTVFVICEEDDQQPLVFDDHLSPSEEMLSTSYEGNSGGYEEDATRDGCDFSTSVTVPEDYRYPCTRITSSCNSFVTNKSTTINSRHESAQDAHSHFNQMGLAKD